MLLILRQQQNVTYKNGRSIKAAPMQFAASIPWTSESLLTTFHDEPILYKMALVAINQMPWSCLTDSYFFLSSSSNLPIDWLSSAEICGGSFCKTWNSFSKFMIVVSIGAEKIVIPHNHLGLKTIAKTIWDNRCLAPNTVVKGTK